MYLMQVGERSMNLRGDGSRRAEIWQLELEGKETSRARFEVQQMCDVVTSTARRAGWLCVEDVRAARATKRWQTSLF